MAQESELPQDPLELDAVDRAIRINELAEKARSMGIDPQVEKDCPPEIEEQFLENVMRYEEAPVGSRFEQLESVGVELPAPETLDDAALHAKLWEVINTLATLDVYLSRTDHLNDRELYEHLWSESLREDIAIFPPGSGWRCHIDPLGGCSEEDLQMSLRYYESEEDRQHWAQQFPSDVIPPHEDPPFDRDRLLPVSPDDQPRAGDACISDEWEDEFEEGEDGKA